MIEIEYKKTLHELLEYIETDTNKKSSVSNGKLKNDFGNIYYLTNNKTRANILNNILVSELSQSSTKTIIPPTIIPYTIGFVHLASLAKFGSIDTLNICEYSDEWFNLFIYSLTTKTIQDSFFIDSFGEIENKRANLSKDFKNFIRDVILNLKEDKLEQIIKEDKFSDEVSQMFFSTYQEYKSVEKDYKYSKTRFIHPLSAYKYLYETLKNKEEKNCIDKVIIVENFDMLEPIFQEILKNIDCPVYVIQDEPYTQDSYLKNTLVYNFMTPLDEAEFVGWKIKDLMQQGISGTDISVCCATQKSVEVLETVFDRFKISGDKQTQFIDNRYYRLVKTMFDIIYNQDTNKLNLQDIFYDKKSKFMLNHGFLKLNDMFIEKGIKSKINSIETLKEVITEFIKENKDIEKYKETIEILNNFVSLTQSENLKIVDIANRIINDKKDKQIINDIMIALYELDSVLAGQSGEIYIKKAKALFSILDTREINSTREKLFLDKENSDEFYEDTYNIEIAKIESLKTLKSKYLFICGLDASFDKNIQLSYPLKIAKAIGLQTLEEKKLLIAESIISAINSSLQNYICYPYLTMDCKETGQASFIKALINKLPKESNKIGENGKLLKSSDVIEINNNKMPDRTWLTDSSKSTQKEIQLIDFKNKLFENMTLNELLKQTLSLNEDGKYHISATNFVDFIQCPRSFAFKILANKCNMVTKNTDGIINTTRGSFWHRILELSALQEDFVSLDFEKVLKVLKDTAKQVLDTTNISKFFLGNKETLQEEIENKQLPLFAMNEIERQKNNNIKVEATEKKFKYDIEGTDFCLSCKFDRIDKTEDGKVFLWDYKMGEPKKDKIQFTRTKRVEKRDVLLNNHNSIQLALYMYIYSKKYNIKDLFGANIYINGKDNLSDKGYSDKIETCINLSLQTLKDNLNIRIDSLATSNPLICDSYANNNSDEGICKYCDFKYSCDIID